MEKIEVNRILEQKKKSRECLCQILRWIMWIVREIQYTERKKERRREKNITEHLVDMKTDISTICGIWRMKHQFTCLKYIISNPHDLTLESLESFNNQLMVSLNSSRIWPSPLWGGETLSQNLHQFSLSIHLNTNFSLYIIYISFTKWSSFKQ